MKKKKLIYTVGLPASGKSTWAKDAVEKSQGKMKRVNKDDLRAMIDSKWNKNKERFVVNVRDQIIREALTGGFDVVVDDTNLQQVHVDRFQALADECGADLEKMSFMHVPVYTCIERDEKRAASVGRDVIWNMHCNMRKDTEVNHSLKDCVIVDLDGTFCLYEGNAYDRDFINDKMNMFVKEFVDYEQGRGSKLVIFSGRDGKHEDETKRWLDKGGVKPDVFAMRRPGDRRKDFEVKKEMFENHIDGVFNVRYVMDDRPQVVRLWKSMGIPVLWVGDGKEF
jgi:predicted kinase